MKHIIRDKTAYAYKEVGSGPPPLVFVHGWACDHNFFSPQIDYFSRYHRVIAPDLPGHGASDACPLQKYTVMQFADDSHGSAENSKSSKPFSLDTAWAESSPLRQLENICSWPPQFA